jgi:hypothetical protein
LEPQKKPPCRRISFPNDRSNGLFQCQPSQNRRRKAILVKKKKRRRRRDQKAARLMSLRILAHPLQD